MECLISLSRTQQGQRKNNADLIEIANALIEDCADITDLQFRAAVSECRKTSPWFPTSCDIITKHKELSRFKSYQQLNCLPMPELKPEQVKENIKRCQQIKKVLARKNSLNY